MNQPHPYDLIVGLDRSDTTADLHFIDTHSGQRRSQTIATAPEALGEWLRELRQQHPHARVALCLEQPAVHLIAFLEGHEWITLYPVNPITLQKFREAFVTSRAKDDAKDAQYLAELLWSHHQQLQPWSPDEGIGPTTQSDCRPRPLTRPVVSGFHPGRPMGHRAYNRQGFDLPGRFG